MLRYHSENSVMGLLFNAPAVYTNIKGKDKPLRAFSRSYRSILLGENKGRILLGKVTVEQKSA